MLKKKTKHTQPAYLTKRILVSAARAGGIEAAKDAMRIMGYTVTAQGGWIVKKYADGKTEKIERIPSTKNNKVALD